MKSYSKFEPGDMVEFISPYGNRVIANRPKIGKVVSTQYYKRAGSWAATIQWENSKLEHWQEDLKLIPPEGTSDEEL